MAFLAMLLALAISMAALRDRWVGVCWCGACCMCAFAGVRCAGCMCVFVIVRCAGCMCVLACVCAWAGVPHLRHRSRVVALLEDRLRDQSCKGAVGVLLAPQVVLVGAVDDQLPQVGLAAWRRLDVARGVLGGLRSACAEVCRWVGVPCIVCLLCA